MADELGGIQRIVLRFHAHYEAYTPVSANLILFVFTWLGAALLLPQLATACWLDPVALRCAPFTAQLTPLETGRHCDPQNSGLRLLLSLVTKPTQTRCQPLLNAFWSNPRPCR